MPELGIGRLNDIAERRFGDFPFREAPDDVEGDVGIRPACEPGDLGRGELRPSLRQIESAIGG